MRYPVPKMEVVLVDSWNDRLILDGTKAMDEEAKICLHDYFIPCANCGVAVLTQSLIKGLDVCIRCNEGMYDMEPITYIKSGVGTAPKDESSKILEFMSNCTTEDNTPCVDCNINDVCTKSIELPLRVVYACAWCHEEITEAMYYVKIDNIPYHAICNENRKSAMLDMALTQTLPEDKMKSIAQMVRVDKELNIEDRILMAADNATSAFWNVIAASFPDAEGGDLDPHLTCNFEEFILTTIRHWVENNVPKRFTQTPRGNVINDMSLYYHDTWHLWHSGGYMVAITDNVAIAGEYRYLVVSSDYVAAYVDDFTGYNFLNDYLFSWNFGDNPAVLMNYLYDYLGNDCLFDMNKLFDDIITIAKSDKVA